MTRPWEFLTLKLIYTSKDLSKIPFKCSYKFTALIASAAVHDCLGFDSLYSPVFPDFKVVVCPVTLIFLWEKSWFSVQFFHFGRIGVMTFKLCLLEPKLDELRSLSLRSFLLRSLFFVHSIKISDICNQI